MMKHHNTGAAAFSILHVTIDRRRGSLFTLARRGTRSLPMTSPFECTRAAGVLDSMPLCLLLATSTSHVAPQFGYLNRSLTALVEAHSWTRVALNLYLDAVSTAYPRVHPRITIFSVAGFKTLFWKRILTPAIVAPFTHVFFFDDDMRVAPGEFQLVALLRMQAFANVSLISPAPIGGGRGMFAANKERYPQHNFVSRQAADIGCPLRLHAVVELKAPLFTAAAWAVVYTELLSKIPDSDLVGPVIDRYWCGLLEHLLHGCDAHLSITLKMAERPADRRHPTELPCYRRLGGACAYSYITPMRHDDHKSLTSDFGMSGFDTRANASAHDRGGAALSAIASAEGTKTGSRVPKQWYNKERVERACKRAGLAPYAWAQPAWRPKGTRLAEHLGTDSRVMGCWHRHALHAALEPAWNASLHEDMHRRATAAEKIIQKRDDAETRAGAASTAAKAFSKHVCKLRRASCATATAAADAAAAAAAAVAAASASDAQLEVFMP
jgi:hypothetical protein